ncbi:MAG: glycosyl hydrolase family 79 C-terminal domain-containing protein [Actinomycetota bacterium]|nr:glycosyl hydrolase family 79 C-terminal domain-containing protein [Actinomycetota bacterium]
MRRHRRFLGTDIAVVVVVAVATVALALLGSSSGGGSSAAASITVDSSNSGAVIPRGFLGLSLEYTALEPYAGQDPLAPDPVFLQLIRNLSPGQRPSLRIGGDTTDSTWWPVPGLSPPGGVRYSLTNQWLGVTHAVAAALHARLILGINLKADSQALASSEAQALLSGVGRRYIEALELGNEPALYSLFTWYRTASGRRVKARSLSYDFPAYVRDFTRIAAALPNVPLAGPALNASGWISGLGSFLAAQPRVRIATVHRYPLQLCFVPPSSLQYPTVPHLLARSASAGLARLLAPYVATAHARGLPFRLDETNSVACGADPSVSRTFAAALWSLDALFALAHVGVDGVNFHTFPAAGYNLFSLTRTHGHWSASVAPVYYGLLMFAQAAPLGARLLTVSGPQPGWFRSWATRSRAGTIRVVLINVGQDQHPVTVMVGGSPGKATLVRLTAPGVDAASGITLAGRSLGPQTETGRPAGTFERFPLAPRSGGYVVSMPPHSAALMTISVRRDGRS